MTINTEIEQAICDVMDLVKEIARWQGYEAIDFNNLDRVESMRGKAFQLQASLEHLDAIILRNREVSND